MKPKYREYKRSWLSEYHDLLRWYGFDFTGKESWIV